MDAVPAIEQPIDWQQPIDSYSSAVGTNADWEGQLRAQRLRNAIDLERNRGRLINQGPDPMTEQIEAQKKQTTYERMLPQGSTSRMAIDVPEDIGTGFSGAAGTDKSGTAAIDRVLGDPEFKGHLNVAATEHDPPRVAIDRTEPMGGYTTGEVTEMGLERQRYRPAIETQLIKNQGLVDERLATSREADELFAEKAMQSRKLREVETLPMSQEQKAAMKALINSKIDFINERLTFRQTEATHKTASPEQIFADMARKKAEDAAAQAAAQGNQAGLTAVGK